MTSETTHTGVVSALAFGGQGIIRHEGLVVFVPFTAIGDRIAFKIVNSKKNYAQGCLVSVIEPSPIERFLFAPILAAAEDVNCNICSTPRNCLLKGNGWKRLCSALGDGAMSLFLLSLPPYPCGTTEGVSLCI